MSVLDSMAKQPNDLPENGCRSTSRHGSKRTGGARKHSQDMV